MLHCDVPSNETNAAIWFTWLGRVYKPIWEGASLTHVLWLLTTILILQFFEGAKVASFRIRARICCQMNQES